MNTHMNKVVRQAARLVDPKLSRHIWLAAKRARDIYIDLGKIHKMLDLAYDAAYDMRHLSATVACCDVCDV